MALEDEMSASTGVTLFFVAIRVFLLSLHCTYAFLQRNVLQMNRELV